MGTNPRKEVKSQGAVDFAEKMKKVHEEAGAALSLMQETMKKYYDRLRQPTREYQVGDKLWLEATNINTDRPAKKLDDKRFRPFPIIKKVGTSSYKLKLLATWKKISPVFNEALLSPYTPPQYPTQKQPEPPPPILVEGEEEYEIDELMDSKLVRNKLKYLVKWKGYPNQTDWTWKPEEKILQDNRDEFYEKYPNAQ